jgi:hypothetical protein
MKKKCERCGAARPAPDRDDRNIDSFDYCAVCAKNLCDACMQAGCCENVPARSGMHEDFGEDADGNSPPVGSG